MLRDRLWFWSRVWLFGSLMLVSAIPLLVIEACVWSYYAGEWIHRYDPGRPLFVRLASDHGRLICTWSHSIANYPPGWEASFIIKMYASDDGQNLPGTVLGFHLHRLPNYCRVQVPYWFVLTLLSLPAFFVWRRRLRQIRSLRRVSRGACPGCGYDLRASPDYCPECGRRTTMLEKSI